MRRTLAKFFMLGVIPFVFTVLLILFVLSIMGVNIGEEIVTVGQKVPVVGKLFDREQKNLERELERLTRELEEQKELTESLRQELTAEQEKTAELLAEQQEEAEKQQLELNEQFMDSYRQIAKSLENMSARKAAPIVMKMPTQEALMTLYSMKSEPQSELLSKMPPDQAAAYTTMLKELLQYKEHMTLAQATEEVVNKYEEQYGSAKVNRTPADGIYMFAEMNPVEAAAILQEMPEADALAILRKLDSSTRAAIVSRIDQERVGSIAQKLAVD